ncbi:MAG: M4 family metallopeptidase [Myxococcales bacterium]|nr:M4 family metallopeptidase [Myxococcales bacterium]
MRTKKRHTLRGTGLATLVAIAGCAAPDDGTTASPLVTTGSDASFARVDRMVLAADGLPAYIRGDLGRIAVDAVDVADALGGVIPKIAAAFRIGADDLIVVGVQRDALGMTHVRYAQQKQGLRVVGGDLVVHVGADGVVRAVTSTARDGLAVDPTPTVELDRAIATASAATADGQVTVHGTDLVYVFATGDGRLYLAWEVELLGLDGALVADRVYVDAHGGAVVDRHPDVFPIKNREVFDAQGRSPPYFSSPGPRLATEGSPPTSDVTALAAYDNTGATYDCYQAKFGRDSYDNRGAKLTSVVHAVFQTPSGQTANNAAWVGSFGPGMMVYGDGDGQLMAPLARALDVTAHELTHAVTSSTAQLAYQNESGALNEAMSDIMASVCEAWKDDAISLETWQVGEDVFTPGAPGDAMRYMYSPTLDSALYPPELGGSRDFYADRYTGSQDNGGVHLNSGIANLAFYLLSEGGLHPRQRVTFRVNGIGLDKAGAIFQRALTQGYLTMNSNFTAARTATEEVARDLYGPAEVTAVGTAWAAVGVGALPVVNDTTPPTVAITSPADGAAVAAGFAVDVTATDDQGVLRVELAVDGALVGTDNSPPYQFDTAGDLAVGEHTLTATAFDAANQATATSTITVVGADQVCTPACGDGETCVANACVPGNGAGDESGICGCSSGQDPASALALGAVGALLARRRRRTAR